MSQVYQSRLSSDYRGKSGNPSETYRKIIGVSFLIAIFPTVLLFFFVQPLFSSLFGSNWKTAGEFAQIMCPLLMLQFIVCPVNMALLVIGERGLQFFWELARLTIMLIGWSVIFGSQFSSHFAVTFHVAVNILMILIFLIITDRALKRKCLLFPVETLRLVD